MNVGLDIDGVLYPWHDSIYRYFRENKNFGGNVYEFWDYFKTLDKDSQTYYVDLPTLYLDTTPTMDVLTYVPLIADIATIYYITSRSPHLKPVTQKFFKNFDLPFKENVIFSSDKANYIRLNKIEYFLDDLPNNVDKIKNICNAYLFRADHNYYQRFGYNVIYTMREYYELIKNS